MARKFREFNYEKYYHVYNKFNPELSIPDDALSGLYDILKQAKEKFNFEVINYSFQNNHFHLTLYFKQKNENILKKECNISTVMHWISLKFAKYVNFILNRHGRVFYDRFKSKLIENVRQFFTVFKYILNNSIKHRGIEPKLWPYSAFDFYKKNAPNPVITHFNDLLDLNILNDDLGSGSAFI